MTPSWARSADWLLVLTTMSGATVIMHEGCNAGPRPVSVYLDIQNLYYAKNPEGIAYNYDFSQSQPITGLPFLPVFGLRGDF